MTKITGIDLGLAKMGLVTIDISDDKIGEIHHTLATSSPDDFKTDIGRWAYMCDTALAAIKTAEPELVACEFPFGSKGNGRINAETFAVIKHYCFKHEIPLIPVAQSTLKKYATGHGKAEKSDMRLQLYKEFTLEYGEDETDAFWLAHLGYAIRYFTEKKHRQEAARELSQKHMELPF